MKKILLKVRFLNYFLCSCTLFFSSILCADSINLFNDSSYTLKAVIYDATGTLMGEFILNPRDATEWNNNYQDAGTDSNYQITSPYTVDWLCTQGGSEYGSCNYVAAGATVTAQSCGGMQQCPSSSSNPPESPLTKSP